MYHIDLLGLAHSLVAVACVIVAAEYSVLWTRNLTRPTFHERRPSRVMRETILAFACFALLAMSTITGLHLNDTHVVVWVACMLAAYTALNILRPFDSDGADQMIRVTLAGLLCYDAFKTNAIVSLAALCFVAFQACSAYCISGVIKLGSRSWQDGSALTDVLGTNAYGTAWASGFLSRRPILRRLFAWCIIITESIAPLALVLPAQGCLAILGALVMFHVFNAWFMGFNTFLWAYTATFPIIFDCNRLLYAYLGK